MANLNQQRDDNFLSMQEQHDQITQNQQPLLGKYRSNKTHTKSIFQITNEELKLFFEKRNMKKPDNEGEARISLNILRDVDYNAGLCRRLCSDPETGIIGDPRDLHRRQEIFGTHSIALPEIQSYFNLLCANFEDSNVIFLTWAAFLYTVASIFNSDEKNFAYIESLTINSGIMLGCLVAGLCDWIKERQFLQLKDEINNQNVTVYRGAFGTVQSIPVRNLVVGDIVDINQGDRVPADCILIEEMNITVDQSMYYKKQPLVQKDVSVHFGHGNEMSDEIDNHNRHPDPFLLSDSKVMTGQGKAIVCCVGDNTLLARSRRPEQLKIQEQNTVLEQKLNILAKGIEKYAIFATFLCLVSQLVYTAVLIFVTNKQEFFSNDTILKIGRVFITAVVILIVAIPEGLPLAVSIAMALSIENLKKDKILIKNIESIQTCATVHDICVGKTGTLTEGNLKVSKYQLCSQFYVYDNNNSSNPNPKSFKQDQQINENLKDLIKEAIISNSDVRIEVNETQMQQRDFEYKYEPKGQALEVGMIEFLMDNDEDVQNIFINRNRATPKIIQLPFDQDLKRKVVVRQINGEKNKELVRVYVKGAPEAVVKLCTETLDPSVQPIAFTPEDQTTVLQQVASNDMGMTGLKPLTYAFKQIRIEELNNLLVQYPQESDEFRQNLESNLIYLGTFGLDDPVSHNVDKPIQMIRFGHNVDQEPRDNNQVNVRMVTGDHLETAKYVALKTKIVSHDECNLEGIALTGEQFRQQIGNFEKIYDPFNKEWRIEFENQNAFEKTKRRVKIIARATPLDKFILVCGIKQRGGLVAMCGDSIADADALKAAHVGMCMGTGCDVAKDNSDLVILDNDFFSIQRAIKWGRAIYDNVRKFIQFQMTVNISMITMTFIGGATLGHTPLNVIQMIWINLIMDILAAIALGTETFKRDDAVNVANKSNRISRKERIMLPEMWRQIFIQSTYQVLVVLFLMYGGPFLFFENSFNPINAELRHTSGPKKGQPTDKMRLNTMVFHTFVLMTLFNQINSRIIDANQINICKTICNSLYFWVIMIIELIVQHFMLLSSNFKVGSALFGTAPLSFEMLLICWGFGLFSLIVNIIAKKIPLENFKFTSNFSLESERPNDKISRLVDSYQNAMKSSQAMATNQQDDSEFML